MLSGWLGAAEQVHLLDHCVWILGVCPSPSPGAACRQWLHLQVSDEALVALQCEDSKVDALGEALQRTVSRWKCKFSAPLPLELYTSSNFIGLFVKEDSAEVLKKFAADFAAEAASKTGEPPVAAQPILLVPRSSGREGGRKGQEAGEGGR